MPIILTKLFLTVSISGFLFLTLTLFFIYIYSASRRPVDRDLSDQFQYPLFKRSVEFHPFGQKTKKNNKVTKLKISDIKTFKVLSYNYAKTDSQVFYNDTELKDVDAASFEFLWGDFGKDRNNLYSGDEKLEGCLMLDNSELKIKGQGNTENFLVCAPNKIYDKNSFIKVPDATKIELVNNEYLKDDDIQYKIPFDRKKR